MGEEPTDRRDTFMPGLSRRSSRAKTEGPWPSAPAVAGRPKAKKDAAQGVAFETDRKHQIRCGSRTMAAALKTPCNRNSLTVFNDRGSDPRTIQRFSNGRSLGGASFAPLLMRLAGRVRQHAASSLRLPPGLTGSYGAPPFALPRKVEC